MWVFSFLIILFIIGNAQCAKILGVFPMSSRSHYILGSTLMKALAEKGHDVTIINAYEDKDPPEGGTYRTVVLTGFLAEHDNKIKTFAFGQRKISPILMVPFMSKMMLGMTEEVLNHTNVQKLINSNEKFDVVIIEEFALHALKALAPHFGAHLVLLSTFGANSWVNVLVGNPTPLSYVSDFMLGYPPRMNFCERFTNTIMYSLREMVNYFYLNRKQNQLVQKYFPNPPHLDDFLYNVSLVLVNSHPSTNQPVPYVPNMVDIGGFHIKPPKELPNDLKKLIEGDKNGVIYFSLGSNMKSSIMPPEKLQIFLNTFSKLKQTVIWKWEKDELPGKSSNVYISKWLPQQDILAHPNVKLFITHAGLLSTFEITYQGIPVLAIPIGGDQKLNAKQIVENGVGLSLDFQDLDEDILLEKINKLLNDPTYSKNAKSRSNFYHDRLVTPLETAIYWIEYVIRHGGAPHLRVAGVDLHWYQYLLLDVIVFVGGVLVVVWFIFKKIAQKICCREVKNVKVKKQ